ncbi:MAG TPA: alginate export family protein [Planctomycetota bacterium]|nr:alginate export family protein [Planctomycetota bacterium]
MKSGVGMLLPILAWAVLMAPGFAADETPAPTPMDEMAKPGVDQPAPAADQPAPTSENVPAETTPAKTETRTSASVTGPLHVPTLTATGLMPVDVKSIEIIFDLRFRYAAWHNSDQGNALAKQYNDDFLMRSRLGVWLMVNEHVNAMITFHDWRRFGENKAGGSVVPASVNANFGTEIRQAWIEFVDLFRNANLKFDLKIGRQIFWTGSERLISQGNWSQTGNLLDGISSLLAAVDGSWNARFFYFRLEREDGSVVGLIQKLRHFFGVHADFGNKVNDKTHGKINKLQPYIYVLKRDEQEGFEPRGFTIITYGVLIGGNVNQDFNWEAEGALQGGRLFTNYVQAYMLSFVANWTLNLRNGGYHPVLSFMFDWASGDNDSTDQAQHTFNPLLGENHNYLGEMDVVGRANVRAIALRAALPLPGMDQVNGGQTFQGSALNVTLHQFWLDNSHDNWYNEQVGQGNISTTVLGTYGGVFLPARNPNAPHELGAELDVRLTTRLFHAVDASVFFGHFWPEQFGEKTGVPPARRPNGDFDFFYAQIELFGGAN